MIVYTGLGDDTTDTSGFLGGSLVTSFVLGVAIIVTFKILFSKEQKAKRGLRVVRSAYRGKHKRLSKGMEASILEELNR